MTWELLLLRTHNLTLDALLLLYLVVPKGGWHSHTAVKSAKKVQKNPCIIIFHKKFFWKNPIIRDNAYSASKAKIKKSCKSDKKKFLLAHLKIQGFFWSLFRALHTAYCATRRISVSWQPWDFTKNQQFRKIRISFRPEKYLWHVLKKKLLAFQ